MNIIEENKLDEIKGGQIESVTGPIINAVVNVVKLLQEAGYNIGSGVRRMVEKSICPLE